MKTLVVLLSFFTAALGTPAALAEIEKNAEPCETGICLHWWPKLPELHGWHGDRGSSLRYGANALAPNGFTFSNAETVIYARALFKPRMPKATSLETLITDDKQELLSGNVGVRISETKALVTGDGQNLRSFMFSPEAGGNWERVSYGEEGEFYLLFTISSRTASGYKKAEPAYEELIHRYRAKP
ncbi:MAG TPA: hypothetical protein VM146_09735 [Steroidobacteraceae bacterium]|nr:hypothetical protein [Steroidobacteraceae bacterium]